MSFPFTVPLTAKEVITPTSTQRCPLGTRGATADGRIYHYAKAGETALTKGLLCTSLVPANSWSNATYAYLSTPFLTAIGSTSVPVTSRTLQFSSTGGATLTIAKDYFKDGWVWVSGTSTAAGQQMQIKTNTVASSGSSGSSAEVSVTFADGHYLAEVVSTADWFSMVKNEYDGVIIATTTTAPTAKFLGVPNCKVTASYYFWIQTWGPCPVKAEAAAISGNKLIVSSTSVAGTIAGITASTDQEGTLHLAVPLGQTISSSAQGTALIASHNILVHLTIDP